MQAFISYILIGTLQIPGSIKKLLHFSAHTSETKTRGKLRLYAIMNVRLSSSKVEVESK